jgi:hypothetical protein
MLNLAIERPLQYSSEGIYQLVAGGISHKRLMGEIRRRNPEALDWVQTGALSSGKKAILGIPGHWYISHRPTPPGTPGDLTYEAYLFGWYQRYD